MSKKRAAKKTTRRKPAGSSTKRAATARKTSTTRKRATARKPTMASTPKSRNVPKKRNIVVTVGDAHMPKIKAVAAALRSRGLKVDSVLEATGIITGAYSKPTSTLKQVEGVASVEEQPQFQLPPPGSDVQ